MLSKYNYPEIENHIKEHKQLVEKVLDLNKNKSYIFPGNAADFLYSWLKDHITNTDMKYAEFFKKEGVS